MENRLVKFVKTPNQITKIKSACKLAAQTLDMITPFVKPGVSTAELDEICRAYMVDNLNANPAPPMKGFPKATCISLNHTICHGIPGDRVLKNGDILNIDVSLEKDGYFGDNGRMFIVGDKASVKAKKICSVSKECLDMAIQAAKPGVSLKDIGLIIEKHAKANRMSVVKEFCGHGIGSELHEDGFQVMHYPTKRAENDVLVPGLTFTIEPMINFGKADIRMLPDGWTAISKDRSLSAQWEHTLLITETGCEILTQAEDIV